MRASRRMAADACAAELHVLRSRPSFETPAAPALRMRSTGFVRSQDDTRCYANYFAAASTTARMSAQASISHSRSHSSAARAGDSTGPARSRNFAFEAGVVERHQARAERLVGGAGEHAARRRHLDPRRPQLRIEPVDLRRRDDAQLARDVVEGRLAPHLVGEMLEPDGAEAQRDADQVGKAQLRAGVVVPAGMGVLGGDAIGVDVDPGHFFRDDVLVVAQRDERLDGGLDVAAAGIGLDVAVGDAEGGRRRQHDRARLSMRPNAKACMKPSRDSITSGGPCTPCAASSTACTPSRAAWPACRRLMSAPPLTKANRPAALLAAMPSASAISRAREAAQPCDRRGRAEHRAGPGRMKAALAQVGMARPRNRDRGLVAGDDRFDHRRCRSHRIS